MGRYLLVFLFFAIALMSKPKAVTLPFVLLFLDDWPLKRIPQEFPLSQKIMVPIIREKLPLFLLTITMSILTYINHLQSGGVTPFDKLPLLVRIENAFVSYLQYIYKMFWPQSLSILYPPPIHFPFWKYFQALFFCC